MAPEGALGAVGRCGRGMRLRPLLNARCRIRTGKVASRVQRRHVNSPAAHPPCAPSFPSLTVDGREGKRLPRSPGNRCGKPRTAKGFVAPASLVRLRQTARTPNLNQHRTQTNVSTISKTDISNLSLLRRLFACGKLDLTKLKPNHSNLRIRTIDSIPAIPGNSPFLSKPRRLSWSPSISAGSLRSTGIRRSPWLPRYCAPHSRRCR